MKLAQTQILKAALVLVGLQVLAACGSTSPDRQGLPEKYTESSVESATQKQIADPKVNILFVVDNSGSMKSYQEKMSANIKEFSDIFFANKRIDYRIGVVPVYDRIYLNDTKTYECEDGQGKTYPCVRKMNALGELVALKGVKTQEEANKKFIDRDTVNAKEVLRQTVLIGTQWGPEAEESFSPVMAVTDKNLNAAKNNNFYQEDAHLVVIFLTDADDVTPGLSGEDFYNHLVQLKNGDTSKVIIVAALPDLNKSGQAGCLTDGRGPVQAFPGLMAASNGLFANLCSDQFGSTLSQFAKKLVQKVSQQKIDIGFTPDLNTLKVFYGDKSAPEEQRIVIPRGAKGYRFIAETNQIELSSELNLPRMKNAVVSISAKAINWENAKNGRLQQY